MLAILVSLAILVILTFRRWNLVTVGIIAALVMAILSGQPVVTAITDTYMTGTAAFIKSNFLIFFFSVLFGKIMEETGAAASIANFLANLLGQRFAILGVIFSGAVLVYGGVTALVVIFSLYPIALALFKKADLPRYLLPGALAGGCFTFACAHFPGTPQLVNVIPIEYLGTTASAAPLVGCITGTFLVVLECGYFLWEAKRAKARGDHFVEDDAVREALSKVDNIERLPPVGLSVLPIILILVVLNVLKQNVVVAMLAGIIFCGILFYKNIKGILNYFEYAAKNASIAIVNTAVVVGFGSVVQASDSFQQLVDQLMSIKNLPPLLAFGIIVSLLCGACGSGSGGLGIAFTAIGEKYLALGLAPEILHRVACAACVGLDSLPHNGAVVTVINVCGMSHKESYKYIFVSTVVFTMLALFLSIGLGMILYPL